MSAAAAPVIFSSLNPIIILFAAIFTGNILLSNFLGTCSFIAISKDLKAANGLGAAVTFVIGIATILSWLLYYYVLIPLNLIYVQYLVFIIIIAALVQFLEMVIERFSPSLYMALGIYLPLITVNCAVLGVILFMQVRNYNFIQSLIYGFAGGAGWWLAIVLLASMRSKINKAPVPKALEGPGITFITIGFMAMAFTGFNGLLPLQ